MKNTNTIKASKSYTVKELLHFSIGHLRAAKFLYNNSPEFYDSAGHLSYLGIELLLKAWLLHSEGQHPKIHRLMTLWGKIISLNQKSLQTEKLDWMQQIDSHYNLRYPPESHPVETGSDDWDKTEKLFSELCLLMPIALQKEIQELNFYEKGGRILLKKPIL